MCLNWNNSLFRLSKEYGNTQYKTHGNTANFCSSLSSRLSSLCVTREQIASCEISQRASCETTYNLSYFQEFAKVLASSTQLQILLATSKSASFSTFYLPSIFMGFSRLMDLGSRSCTMWSGAAEIHQTRGLQQIAISPMQRAAFGPFVHSLWHYGRHCNQGM